MSTKHNIYGSLNVRDNITGSTLTLSSITNDNSLTQILARDDSTGLVEYRDVSSIITGATSGITTITASNGLTKSNDNVTLGGILTGNTNIDNNGFILSSESFSASTLSAQTVYVNSGNVFMDNSFGVNIGTNIIDGGSGFFGPVNYLQMRTASDYSEPWFFMNADGGTAFGSFIQFALGQTSTDIGVTFMKPSQNVTQINNNHLAVYDNSGLYSINNTYARESVVGFFAAEGTATSAVTGSVAIATSAVTMTDNYTLYTDKINLIDTPINDNSLTQILARDDSTGLVEYRDVSSIIGAASGDTFVVSGNADVATSQLTFTYNTGGTFTVANSAALFADNDINVTGGTYNPVTGCVTFATNSGTTFDVCGFVTGITDTYVTGGTYNSSTDTIDLTRTDLGTVSITGITDTFYWTTGSTGNYSLKAINDSGLDATGNYSVAQGFNTLASGPNSHAEGQNTTASGISSHAEGAFNQATGDASHAEGGDPGKSLGNTASGLASHAEGVNNTASGDYSHVQGINNTASGEASHAQGKFTLSNGVASHAAGQETIANGSYSYAGGFGSSASGVTSFIHSTNSIVTGDRSVVLGGQNITGITDDTVYVPYLNINNLATGTSVNTLGIDVNGNVVTGITSVGDITRVQPGTNINTGGTENNPVVNLDDDISLNSVSANTISGGTIYSGSTDLYDIFLTTADGNDITRVQDGINTFTGGTGNNPTINVTALTIDNITVSGDSSFDSVSATTIYSGSTNLSDIFATKSEDSFSTGGTVTQQATSASTEVTIQIDGNNSFSSYSITGLTDTFVSGFTYSANTFTISQNDGSSLDAEIDTIDLASVLSAVTFNIGTTGSISATTFYSGSTDLSDIFLTEADGNDITRVQPGVNINTGGTANNPVVNLDDDISLNSVSANTISGGTIYSGSTNLYDIFLTTADGNDITRVQDGINTFTGGTGNNPTVNITGLTIDNINVSGDSEFVSISATTIYSGSTDLSNLFVTEDTFVTGFTYNDANVLTINSNDGSDYSVTVNTMTGLTINGESSGTTFTVNGQSVFSGQSTDVVQIYGSGSTSPIFRVQGSSGELFSITDSLTGSLFAVNDISGLPILEVFDDDTIHMGSYQAPSLNTTVLLNPGVGLSTVYSIPMSAYTGAWFEYTVSNTVGARAGQIMSIFSGNTANITETTTTDIGSTDDVTFSMSANSTNALLQVSAATSGWEVKTIVRSI